MTRYNSNGECSTSLSVVTTMLVLYGLAGPSAEAALPANAILAFDPGQVICDHGSPPNCDGYAPIDVIGSYFGVDANNDGIFGPIEKTAIQANEGVRLGEVQPASGSHPGFPDGSETPSIDMPWVFFSNTGMHQTTAPVAIVGVDDGTGDGIASLDFSGWGVTWNGIPNIPLGGDSANFPSDTGVAVLTCTTSCDIGETFSLDYFAHVPNGDPSGFGGVYFSAHLEGAIQSSTPLPPTKSVSISLAGGSTHECSSPGGSEVQATANILTSDPSDIAAVDWTLDGAAAGSGETVIILVPLGSHTIGVSVDTLASGNLQDSEPVTVADHTGPDLAIHFIDSRTGTEITEVSGNGTVFVTVHYDVSDLCDSEPTASGVAVPVHVVENGDRLKISQRKVSTVSINTSAVTVSAQATDASGNTRNASATLPIGD